MTVMLYKVGTKLKTDVGTFDYIIVEADEVEATEADGWCLTQTEVICPEPKKRTRRTKAQIKEDEANGK